MSVDERAPVEEEEDMFAFDGEEGDVAGDMDMDAGDGDVESTPPAPMGRVGLHATSSLFHPSDSTRTPSSPVVDMPARKRGWGDAEEGKGRATLMSASLPAQYTSSMPIAVPGGLTSGLAGDRAAAWAMGRNERATEREAAASNNLNTCQGSLERAVEQEDDFVPPHVMMSSSMQSSNYSQSLFSSRAEDTTSMLRKDALRLRTAVLKSTGFLDESAHTHNHLNPKIAPAAVGAPWPPTRSLDAQLSAEKTLDSPWSPLVPMGAVPEMRAV